MTSSDSGKNNHIRPGDLSPVMASSLLMFFSLTEKLQNLAWRAVRLRCCSVCKQTGYLYTVNLC